MRRILFSCAVCILMSGCTPFVPDFSGIGSGLGEAFKRAIAQSKETIDSLSKLSADDQKQLAEDVISGLSQVDKRDESIKRLARLLSDARTAMGIGSLGYVDTRVLRIRPFIAALAAKSDYIKLLPDELKKQKVKKEIRERVLSFSDDVENCNATLEEFPATCLRNLKTPISILTDDQLLEIIKSTTAETPPQGEVNIDSGDLPEFPTDEVEKLNEALSRCSLILVDERFDERILHSRWRDAAASNFSKNFVVSEKNIKDYSKALRDYLDGLRNASESNGVKNSRAKENAEGLRYLLDRIPVLEDLLNEATHSKSKGKQ